MLRYDVGRVKNPIFLGRVKNLIFEESESFGTKKVLEEPVEKMASYTTSLEQQELNNDKKSEYVIYYDDV